MVVAADGMFYKSADGRDILDGTAGLWCVNAGHNAPRIVKAVQQQVAEMDYAPNFQFGHPKAFEFASRVADLFPRRHGPCFLHQLRGLNRSITALKIALHYHRARGDAARTRLIGRERGYHGTGFGGISVWRHFQEPHAFRLPVDGR